MARSLLFCFLLFSFVFLLFSFGFFAAVRRVRLIVCLVFVSSVKIVAIVLFFWLGCWLVVFVFVCYPDLRPVFDCWLGLLSGERVSALAIVAHVTGYVPFQASLDVLLLVGFGSQLVWLFKLFSKLETARADERKGGGLSPLETRKGSSQAPKTFQTAPPLKKAVIHICH